MRVVVLVAILLLVPLAAAADDDRFEGLVAAISEASAAPATTAATLQRIARAAERPLAALRVEQSQSDLPWGDILVAYRVAAHSGHPVEKVFAARMTGAPWKEIASDARVDEARLEQDLVAAFPGLKPVPAPAPRPRVSKPAPPPAPEPVSPPAAQGPVHTPRASEGTADDKKEGFADRVRNIFRGDSSPAESSPREQKRQDDIRDFRRGTPRTSPRPIP